MAEGGEFLLLGEGDPIEGLDGGEGDAAGVQCAHVAVAVADAEGGGQVLPHRVDVPDGGTLGLKVPRRERETVQPGENFTRVGSGKFVPLSDSHRKAGANFWLHEQQGPQPELCE